MNINDYCKTTGIYGSQGDALSGHITEVIRQIAQDWNIGVKDKNYNDVAPEDLMTTDDLQYLVFKSSGGKDYYIQLGINNTATVTANQYRRPQLRIGMRSSNSDNGYNSSIYQSAPNNSALYWKILYAENLSKNTRVLTISVASTTDFLTDTPNTRNQSIIISTDSLGKVSLISFGNLSSSSSGLQIISEGRDDLLESSRTRGTIAYNIPTISSAFSVNYFVPFINPFTNNKVDNVKLGICLNNTTWGLTAINYSYVIDSNNIVYIITPLGGIGTAVSTGYASIDTTGSFTTASMPNYILAINLGITAN